MKESPFYKEAKLMLEVLPFVAEETCFALKGGTAINFFVRNMPRLSVDIDLTYLPLEDRDEALKNISEALKRIANKITANVKKLKVQLGLQQKSKIISKLHVNDGSIQIKIEPNFIIRGTAFPTKERDLSTEVEKLFAAAVSIQVVSLADLYGGKICAALDRQHPRDLFDVKVLFENEGITPEIRQGFILYLAGHDRAMSELLEPTRKDISKIYKNQFLGMTTEEVTLDELLNAREELIVTIKKDLTEAERRFLISIKNGTPEWDLLPIKGIDKLPAIQWKIMNVQKMDKKKHAAAVKRLKQVLEVA